MKSVRYILSTLIIASFISSAWGTGVEKSRGELEVTPLNRNFDNFAPADYVQIKDGHLWVNGRNLKLWGAQGGFGSDPAQIDEEVMRFRKLGFNLYRSISVGNVIEINDFDYFATGRESVVKEFDYSFAAMIKNGGYIWIDLINGFRIKESDVNGVDDSYISSKQWVESIKEIGKLGGRELAAQSGLMYWDKRSRAAYFKYLDKMMNHKNPYTGLKYSEDPCIAVIELMNEQWWVPRSLGEAKFENLPAALLSSLLRTWNDWLRAKYGSTEKLVEKWGKLGDGESLEKYSVLLMPLRGAAASDRMSAVLGIDRDYSTKKSVDEVPESAARRRDIVAFLMQIHLDFAKEAIGKVRSYGKKGKGAAVVPVIIDTGASYCMQSQYEHTFGSALACATYVHQIDPDKSKPTYPWLAALSQPPHLNNWVDQNKIEGHPSFLYEIMYFAPGKYRADFALRTLAFATIQDFDIIDWHYYSPYNKSKNEPLRMPTEDHYWNGVIFSNDQVTLASMLLSSIIYQYGDLQEPICPTILEIGNDSLYEMDNVGWGKFRELLSPTVYQYGLRIRFKPENTQTRFVGRYSNGKDWPDVVRPTKQISYYWREGYMQIESECVRVVAGFLPDTFEFQLGERLENISIYNPEGASSIRSGERYMYFALCSRDHKPIAQSSNLIAMAVSTSWNTGFKFDPEKWQELQKNQEHAPLNAAKSIEPGRTPILVCRPGFTLKADWLNGKTIKRYDFNLNSYSSSKTLQNQIQIDPNENLFYLEIIK